MAEPHPQALVPCLPHPALAHVRCVPRLIRPHAQVTELAQRHGLEGTGVQEQPAPSDPPQLGHVLTGENPCCCAPLVPVRQLTSCHKLRADGMLQAHRRPLHSCRWGLHAGMHMDWLLRCLLPVLVVDACTKAVRRRLLTDAAKCTCRSLHKQAAHAVGSPQGYLRCCLTPHPR